MEEITLDEQLKKMRADWDARAKENARYYVATLKEDWTDDEFFASGEQTVAEEILTDMTNICQGLDPKQMRSEERRVGEECRSEWWSSHGKKKKARAREIV